jgi:hypothetical protein
MTIPLLLAFAALAAASDDVREIRKTFSLSPQGRIAIDTYKGTIHVSTWDKPQVELEVRIESDGWNSFARELVRDTQIEMDSTPDTLRLKTRYPKMQYSNWFGSYSNPSVKYTLRAPRTAQLRIKDYKSDILVDALSASLDIETYKGEIRVTKQDGNAVTVKTYKSEARIEFARVSDRMSFESYKGVYNISVPRDARFDLDSNLGRRGDLNTSFAVLRNAGANSGRGRVNGGGPVLSLKGYRTEVNLR